MKTNRICTLVVAAGLALFAGCATRPQKKAAGFTFFPPAPNEPRIQYLTSFGSEKELGSGSKFADFVMGNDKVHRPLWKPYGITSSKGFIYVCDTQAGNVTTVDLEKRKFRYARPGGREALQVPINVAVDAAGKRYVSDTRRGQVVIFGADDNIEASIGEAGEMKPCGLAIVGDRLYVGDLSNHCVRMYDVGTRKLRAMFPNKSTNAQARILAPTNLAVDKDGNVYVSDTSDFAVKVYDRDGNYLRTVGEMGIEAGRFALPKGIAVDREKRMYVVDGATAVVQLFDDQGRLLMYFGEPKSSGPAGLYLPACIAIDYENVGAFAPLAAPGYKIEHLIYITNQAGPNKVSVYAFVRKG
jgi:hypothetical protein